MILKCLIYSPSSSVPFTFTFGHVASSWQSFKDPPPSMQWPLVSTKPSLISKSSGFQVSVDLHLIGLTHIARYSVEIFVSLTSEEGKKKCRLKCKIHKSEQEKTTREKAVRLKEASTEHSQTSRLKSGTQLFIFIIKSGIFYWHMAWVWTKRPRPSAANISSTLCWPFNSPEMWGKKFTSMGF